MLRKDDILLTQPALWSKLKVYGKTIKYVQLLTPNLSSNVSVVPAGNQIGSYITILDPSLVGHKVYVKVIADTEKIGLCFFKEYGLGLMAYNLLNGEELYPNTEPTSATEGVFTITQDMVHSGTNYLQLYYFVYSGLPTGSHTITVQLVDLTELGMDNIINPVLFNATDLGKYMQNNTLNRGSGLISVESPLKASEGTYNQLVQNGNFENAENWNATNGTISASNNELTYKITSIGGDLASNRINQNSPAISHIGFVKVSIKAPYDTTIRIFDTAFRIIGTALANKWTDLYYFSSSLQNNHLYFDVHNQSSYQTNDEIQVKNYIKIDLTQLGLDSITTIDQFYATNVGKLVKKYGYLPYSANNTQFGRTLNIIKEGNHIKLNGIGDLKDTYTNYNGKYNKVFGEYIFTGNETWTLNGTDTSGVYKFHCSFSGLKVLEGGGVKPNLICSGLETKTNNQMYSKQNGIGQNSAGTEIVVFNSSVQTANDMKTFMQGRKLIYELATPITETLSSKMIPSGITEIIDKNGVGVEYKKL